MTIATRQPDQKLNRRSRLEEGMAQVSLYDKINHDSQGDTEPNSLLQKLRNKITKSVQTKVDNILDVQKLTDYDKLYLYLQLPAGPSAPEKSLDIGSVNTAEHMHACTWIRNHLEEHTDTCLPKQDVYDAYKRYCDNLHGRPLSVANFGKIIREIFPNIKARRLGGRGQSKYCYSGLRRKSVVSLQPLPSLDLKVAESSELTDLVQSYNNDVINASCDLICSWAEQILKRSFNNIVEVAQFLIQQHLINPRSANADLVLSMVLSENPQGGAQKTQKQPVDGTGNKGADSPDGGTDAVTKQSKTTSPNVSSPQQSMKKRPPEPQKPANSPQVDALVAKYPPVLPRPTSEKFPIRMAPSMLAPKIIPGSLPFTAVPVTAGINGTGLISPPLIMIQPDLVSQPHPKAPHNSSKERAVGGWETKGLKRRSEAEPAAGATAKRKRGRPRKVASPDNNSAQSGAPSSFTTDKAAESSGRDSLQCAVPELYTGGALPTASHSNAEGGVRGQTLNLLAPPPSAELQPTAAVGTTKTLAGSAPIQVSVITDARQSMAFWTMMKEDAGKRLTPPKDEHNKGWPPEEKVRPLPEQ
ncbi:DNA-binding protein RFX5 isoform X3 [Xenopus laevis]|uniref:DNA-binding protein RFX5 isoform X3 n=1 Tax=Xenopus laevis TaxID=8355 RepID=A0A8J1LM12_XENLA|nr:DNA-binding protein RFX5 isoform X3 [Xenopus laevis]